jgi:hypothetical protein
MVPIDGGKVPSKHPLSEGFRTYEDAHAYLVSQYGGRDNNGIFKIIRYA